MHPIECCNVAALDVFAQNMFLVAAPVNSCSSRQQQLKIAGPSEDWTTSCDWFFSYTENTSSMQLGSGCVFVSAHTASDQVSASSSYDALLAFPHC
jgi:hypothetical protein